MIQVKKSYVVELQEDQARQLYNLLQGAKDVGHLSVDRDLILIYNELKDIFGGGIR